MIKNCNRAFVETLFNGLNKKSIHYAICGDYEGLPDKVGHDIDMWTDDIEGFRKVLMDAIRQTEHKVLIDNKTANGCNVVFFKRNGETMTFMKVDVLKDTSWKSILPLEDKEITASSVIPYKNFYVVNPEGEALGHFLYPMFEWGFIKKEHYKDDIKRYCHCEVFYSAFKKLWGEKTAQHVLMMINEERWDDICKEMGSLKRKALLRGFFKGNTWNNAFKTIYYTMRRWFVPSGKCLAFCGLDGAGKTTILDELNMIFVDLLKSKKVFYGYWRPYVIPEIRELFGKKNSKDGIDQKAQKGVTVVELEKKPKNKLVSMVKLLYYWLDYMFSPLKYGGIRSRGGMVLFDRHYVDMAVHPQRFEMSLPRWLILFLYKLIQKADYTFFLYCTPDEILQRKQEFTKEEIQKMTDDYLKVGKRIKNFIPIHTNTSIAEEIDEILSHISER